MVTENRILNGNQLFGPHKDSKTNVCVCDALWPVLQRERANENSLQL